jgi:RNA polymerase sigma factor (TIGR02999 family)
MTDVSLILDQIQAGEPQAAEKLLPLVYDELRKLAAAKLAHEKPGQTLQATALVHEAYLRLVGSSRERERPEFANRAHFFAAAAEAIRRILVEQARHKNRVRHGGGRRRIDLDEACSLAEPPSDDLLALEVVKLRHFGGLTMPEVAETLGISLPTAERYWAFARTWLFAELNPPDPPAGA